MTDGEFYDRIETANIGKLKRIQLRKLKKVVKQAYEYSPFYQRRFKEAGVHPDDIGSFDDFARKIPIFRKHDVRMEMAKSGDPLAGVVVSSDGLLGNVTLTSGLSGPNTFVGLSKRSVAEFARRQFVREMWMQKVRPGMRVLAAAAGWHFFSLPFNKALDMLKVDIVSPYGTHFPEFAGNFLKVINTQKPDYVMTVPTMLLAMRMECRSKELEASKVFSSVKYVSVVGERIPLAARRRIIDELGIEDLFEKGGSSDGLWGGGECWAHQGHHVWMDFNYLEVVDPKTGEALGPGEKGTVVSTNLSTGRSTFIRFDCEDLVQELEGECPCGRTHTRIEILDRLSNVVRVEGREVTHYQVAECFEAFPETAEARFSMIKDAEDMPVLRVKAWHSGGPERSNHLRYELEKLITERLKINVEIGWIEYGELPAISQKVLAVTRDLEPDLRG